MHAQPRGPGWAPHLESAPRGPRLRPLLLRGKDRGHLPGPQILPDDPATLFASRLLEDYADEWPWWPAMHAGGPSRKTPRSSAPAWPNPWWRRPGPNGPGAPLPTGIPEDPAPLRREVSEVYLPYLDARADAFARGLRRLRYRARDVEFLEPVKPYRVWCRGGRGARGR